MSKKSHFSTPIMYAFVSFLFPLIRNYGVSRCAEVHAWNCKPQTENSTYIYALKI